MHHHGLMLGRTLTRSLCPMSVVRFWTCEARTCTTAVAQQQLHPEMIQQHQLFGSIREAQSLSPVPTSDLS